MYRGRVASEFGAPDRGQWPPWSIRRFLLYQVLLHELGHLQVVRPEESARRRRYASEPLADDLAHELRGRLYSDHFEHPDPIHNAPSDDERATLSFWNDLHKDERLELARRIVDAPHPGSVLAMFNPRRAEHTRFLTRALCHVVPR
jgi:hypothetical protein